MVLLAALQVVAPVAALAADDAPPASHVDHVGAPDDGCHTFHDELFCLSCRVLTAAPADSRPAPAVLPRPVQPFADSADGTARYPAYDPAAPCLARAPPRP